MKRFSREVCKRNPKNNFIKFNSRLGGVEKKYYYKSLKYVHLLIKNLYK